jgi:hypothetical protein
MDALSQLSYTPVTVQNDLQVVWQTAIILTNLHMKFHWDEPYSWTTLLRALPDFLRVLCVHPSLLSHPQRKNFH